MVILRMTEVLHKSQGFNKIKKGYEDKIEIQKKVFDRKIQQFERNLEEKKQLIAELQEILKSMKESTGSSKGSSGNIIISVLEQCIYELQNDIKITSNLSATSLLQTNHIRNNALK